MEQTGFKHKFIVRVQFHEVDLLGVCNNAIYFNFFETARLDYMKKLNLFSEIENVLHSPNFFLLVHNECDYFEPAYYDDELIIYTRIKYIKNSSFGFEHVVEKKSTGKIIAKSLAAIVYISRSLKKSVPLPSDFYTLVESFEGKVENLKE